MDVLCTILYKKDIKLIVVYVLCGFQDYVGAESGSVELDDIPISRLLSKRKRESSRQAGSKLKYKRKVRQMGQAKNITEEIAGTYPNGDKGSDQPEMDSQISTHICSLIGGFNPFHPPNPDRATVFLNWLGNQR